MERTIQFESRTNELPRILLFENDANVLEFWDQPNHLKLTWQINGGDKCRNYTGHCVPDFFLLEYSGCGWVECKTEQELQEIASKSTRFVKRSDGTWISPAGEAAANEYGLFFRVLSTDGINPILYNNLLYLDDYYHVNAPPIPKDIRSAIKAAVAANPGILISELKLACPQAQQDQLNMLIACGDLYVDLTEVKLTSPESVRVYGDSAIGGVFHYMDQNPVTAKDPSLCELFEGAEVNIGEKLYTVTAILSSDLLLREKTGAEMKISKHALRNLIDTKQAALLSIPPQKASTQIAAFLSEFTSNEQTMGLQRFDIYNNPSEFQKIKTRTRERWRRRVREAEALWGASYGWVGLLPTYHNGGRPILELKPEVIEILESAFKHWENPSAITFSAFWKLCRSTAHQRSEKGMCCKKRAKRWLKDRRTRDSDLTRNGKAAVNSADPPLLINVDIPPYAIRPWERVYIDHTYADIRLRLDTDTLQGKSMRVWFSVMIDDYSRKVLAFVISFEAPSRDTCMHLIRECVKLHHYLPGKIAMDNGKEFKSIYFQKLLSACWITPEYRPARTAKFGGRMERFFSTANTEMFHQLLGNTKAMKNPRQVTKEVNPESTAVWTLETLHKLVSEFCYVTYNDKLVHSTFGTTPNERFTTGIERHGSRLAREREYDPSFKILTMPGTPRGKLTVGRNGIRMFGAFSFWADGMVRAMGTKVEVRYDPEDVSQVYVFLDGKWVWARSGSHHLLEKLSRRSLKLATQEFFAEQKRVGAAAPLNETTLGRFLESAKCQEATAHQRRLDAQFRVIQEGESENLQRTQHPSVRLECGDLPHPETELKPATMLRTLNPKRAA